MLGFISYVIFIVSQSHSLTYTHATQTDTHTNYFLYRLRKAKQETNRKSLQTVFSKSVTVKPRVSFLPFSLSFLNILHGEERQEKKGPSAF